MSKKPKVSVCCWTYNQEKYIRDALDGIFMQKVNFPMEVIIHDDASTDSTADIVREYEAKYPDMVRAIYQTENQFGKVPFTEKFIFPAVRGEYVAICEGDDYWIDENKLQKQVDFLDANPDFSVCFHSTKVTHEDETIPDYYFPAPKARFDRDVLTIYNLLCWNFIQTNSVMYRWRFNENFGPLDMGAAGVMPRDWYWHLLHAQMGKIKYLDEVMGVYRRNPNGIWSGSVENIHLNWGTSEINFYLSLEKYFPEYNILFGHKYTCKQALLYFKIYLKHQKFAEMQQILRVCPDCLDVVTAEPIKGNDKNYLLENPNELENALRRFFLIKDYNSVVAEILSPLFDVKELINTYYLLDDEYSREMLVKVITYRTCSGKNYKVPLTDIFPKVNTGEHCPEIGQCINEEDFLDFWILRYYLFDLNPIGYDIKLYTIKIVIFVELILKQYAYERDGVSIKAEPGDYVIDGGGCSGDTALYFANDVGEKGKVFSFEFIPNNLDLFHKNINLNPKLKKRIQLVESALWENSTSNLFVKENGPGTYCSMDEFPDYSMKIKTKSIDDFMKEEKIKKIDFIKLDIEGSELSSLHGAKETIQRFKPKLAICIYHKDEDFCTLAQYIKSILPEYNLYLDHYGDGLYETILYAKCKN